VLLWVLPSDLPNMYAAVGRYVATVLHTLRGRRHCCGTQPHNGEMNVAGAGGVTQSDSNAYRSINRLFDQSSGVARGLVVGKLIAHSSWSRYMYEVRTPVD
jgi:hypothetical protein